MNLTLFQRPTCLGSTFEVLSRVEFDQPYAVTLTFPATLHSDATLRGIRTLDANYGESEPPAGTHRGHLATSPQLFPLCLCLCLGAYPARLLVLEAHCEGRQAARM